MKRFNRLGAALLAAGIFAGAFAGCGADKDNAGASASQSSTAAASATAAPKELATISLLVYDRGQIPSAEGTLEENWFTKELNKRTQEKLGLKVKFVPVPNAQREQKLATMLAAGEAPDVCYTYDQKMIRNYSQSGGFLDLAPYIEKYGTDIKKTLGSERLEQAKIDGKLTRLFSAANLPATPTLIRSDWVEKLGMKMPTNVDEFYQVLKAFKEKDPGKVGDKLMPFVIPAFSDSPFGYVDTAIVQAFLKEPPTKERLTAVPYQLWPETKEAYRFLNKLYNEKLMGELIIDKDQSQLKQKLMKGEIGSTIHFHQFMYNAQYGNLLENLKKTVPDANMVGIFPWQSASSKETIYGLFTNGYEATMNFFVPSSSKNPDAAVKYLNYIATDEYISLVSSGIEGTDYKVVDGINTPLDQAKFKDHNSWTWGAYQALAPLYVNDDEKYKKAQSLLYNEAFRADYIKYTVVGKDANKYASSVIGVPTPIQDKNKPKLDLQWKSNQAKFILCSQSEFDKIYDEALNTWKTEGGDEMAKELMDAYKKQYPN